MNKHMKEHSRGLNIKTTRLATLTAIFRSKKHLPPRVADDTPMPAMDVDNTVHTPERDIQMDDLEAISHGLTSLYDNDDDDDDDDEIDGGCDGNTNGRRSEDEAPAMDSDSEDEFESDEEMDDRGVGCGTNQKMLDFEIKAAEAGSVLCFIWSLEQ